MKETKLINLHVTGCVHTRMQELEAEGFEFHYIHDNYVIMQRERPKFVPVPGDKDYD